MKIIFQLRRPHKNQIGLEDDLMISNGLKIIQISKKFRPKIKRFRFKLIFRCALKTKSKSINQFKDRASKQTIVKYDLERDLRKGHERSSFHWQCQ